MCPVYLRFGCVTPRLLCLLFLLALWSNAASASATPQPHHIIHDVRCRCVPFRTVETPWYTVHICTTAYIMDANNSNYPCWCWWNENTYTSHMLAAVSNAAAILIPQVLCTDEWKWEGWHWGLEKLRLTSVCYVFSHWIVFPIPPVFSPAASLFSISDEAFCCKLIGFNQSSPFTIISNCYQIFCSRSMMALNLSHRIGHQKYNL